MADDPLQPWRAWSGLDCPTGAPAGGGGPGQFRTAGVACSWADAQLPSLLAPPQIDRVFGQAGSTLPVQMPSVPVAAPAAFGVRDIPAVMRDALAWPRSAAVMDLWFSKPARAMSQAEKEDGKLGPTLPPAFVDTSLFTMDWLCGFKRADLALQALKDALASPKALVVLAGIGKTLPSGPGSATGLSMASLHAQGQFQRALVDYDGQLDDLYGSLGRFAFYAALLDWQVSAATASKPGRLQVRKVALYMRDTFDFIGSQYLGHWNRLGMGVQPMHKATAEIAEGWRWNAWSPSLGWMTPIGNADFRTWRDLNRAGGDLLLFSDIVVHPVNIELAL